MSCRGCRTFLRQLEFDIIASLFISLFVRFLLSPPPSSPFKGITWLWIRYRISLRYIGTDLGNYLDIHNFAQLRTWGTHVLLWGTCSSNSSANGNGCVLSNKPDTQEMVPLQAAFSGVWHTSKHRKNATSPTFVITSNMWQRFERHAPTLSSNCTMHSDC